MDVQFDIVSIGTLSRNRFWNEKAQKRAPHCTIVLVLDGDRTILVDPGLPAELVKQRLDERTGLSPDDIDTVFLTCFRPTHRRGLALFERAAWFMHEPEVEGMGAHLAEIAGRPEADEPEVRRLIADERDLLARIQPAPERFTESVHLYPAPGVTPGTAGLLLASASKTTIIAGDAVVTREYYEAGRVFDVAHDVELARTSLREISEIADEIVPGHDNTFRVYGR